MKTIMEYPEKAFAIPGEDSIIDLVNPNTGRTWIKGETLEQIRKRYPAAQIVNLKAHCAAGAVRQDSPVTWDEITEEKYWYYLEVVPPVGTDGGNFMVGEAADHHAVTGRARYQAVVAHGGKYWASSRPMQAVEFRAFLMNRRQVMTEVAQ